MADHDVVLRKVLEQVIENEQIKDAKMEIKNFDTEGANYSSTLSLVTISGSNSDDVNLFAKVGLMGKEMRKATKGDKLYRAERLFYKELVESYNEILEKNNVPEEERIVFPKFYGCNSESENETIVLENLIVKGYILYDRLKPVNWEYSAKAIEELAKFHSLSFAYKIEYPDKFDSVSKDLVNLLMYPISNQLRQMFNQMKISSLDATAEEYKERYKKFLDSLISDDEALRNMYRPQRQQLITHGDYRASNLMVKYSGESVEALVPLDFQTIQIGSPINDLVYFIFCGTDEEFRREHYQNLVDHYYNSLHKSMKLLNLDCSKLYPREDFDADLRERLTFGLYVSFVILPIVLVNKKTAPKLEDDVKPMAKMTPTISNLYKERLNGILSDFIKWGLI